MSWRSRMRQWAAQRGRQAQRVAVQGYERARQAGRRLAVRVTAIQAAARLDPKLTRGSLESVRRREHARDADRAWRDGYVRQATPRPPARTAPEPGTGPDAGPDPSWPWSASPVPSGHDRGGVPPGAIPAGSLRPLSFEPSRRAGTDRLPPGHGRLISTGHFASAAEAGRAADAWRCGASFAEYIAMGTGANADREAGQ
jgi:hypothetical protein